MKKTSLLAIAIATSSNVYALDCYLDTTTKTKNCTTNGVEENTVIHENIPTYDKLVIDNANLIGTDQMIKFGPGPSGTELANNPDITLEINNSTIKSSSTNTWNYGGYAAVPSQQRPSQTISMNINNSVIDITAGANRANGLLIESG